MKITTTYYRKPIPTDKFDWTAIDSDTYDAELIDGHWVGGPQGTGATEQEAIVDLVEQLSEQRWERFILHLGQCRTEVKGDSSITYWNDATNKAYQYFIEVAKAEHEMDIHKTST